MRDTFIILAGIALIPTGMVLALTFVTPVSETWGGYTSKAIAAIGGLLITYGIKQKSPWF